MRAGAHGWAFSNKLCGQRLPRSMGSISSWRPGPASGCCALWRSPLLHQALAGPSARSRSRPEPPVCTAARSGRPGEWPRRAAAVSSARAETSLHWELGGACACPGLAPQASFLRLQPPSPQQGAVSKAGPRSEMGVRIIRRIGENEARPCVLGRIPLPPTIQKSALPEVRLSQAPEKCCPLVDTFCNYTLRSDASWSSRPQGLGGS